MIEPNRSEGHRGGMWQGGCDSIWNTSCPAMTGHCLSHLQSEQAFNEQMQKHPKDPRGNCHAGGEISLRAPLQVLFSRLLVIGKMWFTSFFFVAVNYINEQLCAHWSYCDPEEMVSTVFEFLMFKFCLSLSLFLERETCKRNLCLERETFKKNLHRVPTSTE